LEKEAENLDMYTKTIPKVVTVQGKGHLRAKTTQKLE
jgi:hypothetical protein